MSISLSRLRLLHSVGLFCLILLLALAPPLAAQQEPAGRVTVVLGVVEAVAADGDRRRLGRGDSVFEGDTLESGPRGRAQIRFSDRGMVSLRPDSVLSLDSYQDDAASPAANRQEMGLTRGGFRAQTGRVAEANRQGYRVQTPVAVIGIRGTVFDAHQYFGGALLVGSTQGGVEVETSAGVVGRVGAGENFNYLRVNPDGSIDYLLEVPDEFTLSPEVDEGDEDEALDVGDPGQSSVNTGAGTAESTAGISTGAGDQLLDLTNDPDRTGILARSRTGSGEPPVLPRPVLDPDLIERLLADDRIGLALGLPSVTVGEDGELQVGSSALQGGIATFNSPLLALSSVRDGFGSGLATAPRSDILDEADLLLLPDSAESESRQDVAGVPGLIWGRYLSPVLLFTDPADDRQVLELQRDLLFMLGTPSDIANLQGQHNFALSEFEAVSSGLPVMDVLASGLLDVGQARYVGLVDILLGADSDATASLLAEFAADVMGGVLEGIEFGTFDLFDFASESSVAAEGELAGFFTGDAAAFLQLAFDFRVPSRDDADVAGLVLLARVLDLDVLGEAQRAALFEDDAVALALGVEPAGLQAAGAGQGVLARGIGTIDDGAPVLVFDSGATALGAGDREALLGEADALFTADSGEFTLNENVEGSGISWGRFAAPVTQFIDEADADAVLTLDRDLLFALGTPMAIADREGMFSYELERFDVISSGLPVTAFFASGALDFNAAQYRGEIDMLLGEESSSGFNLFAAFESGVSAGVLDSVVFETLDFIDLNTESRVAAEGELAGFFTGTDAEFLQLAFDFRVPSRDDADVAGLALLAQGEQLFESVLTSEQQARLFGDDAVALAPGVEPAGLQAAGAGQGVLARGIGTIDDGAPVLVFDSGATELVGADREALLGEADALFTADSGEFTLNENIEGSGISWGRFAAPVTQFIDEADPDAVLVLERDLLFALGTPVDVADREGAITYELLTATADSSGSPLSGFDSGAALDLDTGSLFGLLEVQFGSEGELEAEIVADFSGVMEAGILGDLEFLYLEFLDLGTGDTAAVDADLAGFLAGEGGAFLQLAFDLRVAGRGDADVSGLALLGEVDEIAGGALTADEFFALQEGFFFVAANCCFEDGGVPTGTLTGRATDASEAGGEGALLAYSVGADGMPLSVADPRFRRSVPDLLLRRENAAFIDEDAEAGLVAFEWRGSESPATAFDAIEGDAVRDFEERLLVLSGRPTRVADLTGFARYEFLELTQGFAFASGETIDMPFADMSFNVDFADGSVTDGVFRAALDFFGESDVNGDFEPLEVQDPGIEDGFAISPPLPTMEASFTGQVTLDGERAFVDFDILDGSVPGEGSDPLDLERSFIDGFFTGDEAQRFAAAFHLETTGFDGEADRILAVGNIVLGRQDLSLNEVEAGQFAESNLAFVGVACCGLEQTSFRGGATEFGPDAVLGVGGSDGSDGMFPVLLRQANSLVSLLDGRGDEGGTRAESVVWSADDGPPLRVDADSGNILERLSTLLLYHVAMPLDVATLEAGFTTFWGDPMAFSSSATQFGVGGAGAELSEGFSASFNVDLDSGDIFAGHLFVVEERVGDGIDLSELGFEVFFDGFVAVDGGEPFAELSILDGSYRQRTPLDLDNSQLDGFFSSGFEQIFFAGSYDLRAAEGEAAAAGIFEISNMDSPETRLTRPDVESWVRFGPEGEPQPGFGIAVFRHSVDSERRAPGMGFLLGRASDPNSDTPFVLGANALMSEATGEHRIVRSDRRDFFGQPFDFVLRENLAIESNFDPDVRPPDGPSFEGFEVSWGAWAGDDGSPGQVQELGSEVPRGVENVFFASVNPTPTSQLPTQGAWSYDSNVAGATFFGAGGQQTMVPIEELTVGFMLDFGSGVISEGALEVSYGTRAWQVEFDGFLNGAVTEFGVTSVDLLANGESLGFDSTPDTTMAGMLTGPDGQRHVGGFNLSGFIQGASGSVESVHGVWVIDGAPQ